MTATHRCHRLASLGLSLIAGLLVLPRFAGLHAESFRWMFSLSPGVYTPAPEPQRTLDGVLDVDRNRRIDLVLVTEVFRGPERTGVRRYLTSSPGTQIVGASVWTNRLTGFGVPPNARLREMREAYAGFPVVPGSPPPVLEGSWFRITDTVSDDTGRTSWGTTNTDLRLGLLVTREDGLHAGWVQLGRTGSTNWYVVDSKVNPEPGAPLAVGESPTAVPAVTWSRPQYSILTDRADSAGRDVILGKHFWTNSLDHGHGWMVDLRGPDRWSWAAPSDRTNELASLPRRIDLNAPREGIVWNTNQPAQIVYSESVTADGTTNRTGPLAFAASAFFGFRAPADPSYAGWVQLMRDSQESAVSVSATVVGGPELPFRFLRTSVPTNLDLDGDGLVDFVQYAEDYRYSDFSSRTLQLAPVPGSEVLLPEPSTGTPYLPPDSASPIGPAGFWTNSTTVLASGWTSGNVYSGFGGSYTNNGLMGVRIATAGGLRFGWIRWEAGLVYARVAASGVSLWPDEAVNAGQPTPAVLRIGRQGTQFRVSWPPDVAGRLERWLPGSPAPWTPVVPSELGSHTERPVAEAVLYRYRISPGSP
jgi:hypothetical protein